MPELVKGAACKAVLCGFESHSCYKIYIDYVKEERKEIKVKVCEEYTYKLLVQRQKDLEQRLKQSRDSYENLLLSYIKLVNQKDKN